MPSLNRVHLIGVVATRPQQTGDAGVVGFVLMTERPRGSGVERHRIVASSDTDALRELHVGASAYVRGHLERRRGRTVVVAAESFVVGPAPPIAEEPERPTTTHRSPAAHERRGHLRHIGAGTPRERLVWVRATTVGDRAPAGE
ncbi:MAG: hypothetical protein JOZ75_11900 [Candidatus Dormibacteraeota bacterium]|nr:hypothetical protein [Candidatus Dormibacteraeota bacterium]